MRALLALLFSLPLLGGCVVVLTPFNWFGDESGLVEHVVRGEGDAKILLVSVDGFISDQPTQRAFGLVQEPSTLDRVATELRRAEADPDIRGVVLRINSPGGGVTASDEIFHRLRRFAEEQDVPVVAALGSVAASGGYYVALAADEILAHPTTVTGSIGVILVGLNIDGLMDKIGVRDETFTSGPHKDLLSPLRGVTDEERDIVQGVLDGLFERFVHVVDDRRGGKLDATHRATITDGRIFNAPQAESLGLVDGIGRLDDAIDRVREKAELENARVIRYTREGARADTVYSRGGGMPTAGGAPAQVNILPLDLGLSAASSAQFLYLWRPGRE